jgi:predicted 2-oxoglutarate/Fe(II)-dependent dioxygenase YbiX
MCAGYLQPHCFELGDALVFQSHKYHCVSEVTRGRRVVLVTEFWLGESRQCAVRCDVRQGLCTHTMGSTSIDT